MHDATNHDDAHSPLQNTRPPATDSGEPVDGRGANDQPGALRGEAWLTLQTRHAQRLLMGRKAGPDKPWIIGLTRFGALTSQLFVCVRMDDPYADWWLVKVEAALSHAEHAIRGLREQVEGTLAAACGIEVTIAHSLKPVRVPLKFANPYAYQAARMIADYDRLVRSVLTARHVGLMDREASDHRLSAGARAIRRALSSVLGYRYRSIKRADLEQNTARASEARTHLGEIPADIVTGTRRARFAPPLPRTGSANHPHTFSGEQQSGLSRSSWQVATEPSDGDTTHHERANEPPAS